MVDVTGALFQIPAESTDALYQVVQPILVTDLTTGVVGGTGAFDLLMAGMKSQLDGEYEIGRITGAEYTKAYIELTQAAMQTALQFVLGKNQAFWDAQNAQIAALTGSIALETARYNYTNALPVQLGMLTAQEAGQLLTNQTTQYNLSYMLPEQLALLTTQEASAAYNLANIQPMQLSLLTEQADAQRGQTSNTRLDGSPVQGVMGAQEALYTQQITSYQRDAEVKAAKIFTDSWITQKTIDDGLLPPTGFTNDSVNSVLTVIMANNGFGAPSA